MSETSTGPSRQWERFKAKRLEITPVEGRVSLGARFGEYGTLQDKADQGDSGAQREMVKHAIAAEKYGANNVVANAVDRAIQKLPEADRRDPDAVADAIVGLIPQIGQKINDRAEAFGADAMVTPGYGEVQLLKTAMQAHALLTVVEFQSAGDQVPLPFIENLNFANHTTLKNSDERGEMYIDWESKLGVNVNSIPEVNPELLAAGLGIAAGLLAPAAEKFFARFTGRDRVAEEVAPAAVAVRDGAATDRDGGQTGYLGGEKYRTASGEIVDLGDVDHSFQEIFNLLSGQAALPVASQNKSLINSLHAERDLLLKAGKSVGIFDGVSHKVAEVQDKLEYDQAFMAIYGQGSAGIDKTKLEDENRRIAGYNPKFDGAVGSYLEGVNINMTHAVYSEEETMARRRGDHAKAQEARGKITQIEARKKILVWGTVPVGLESKARKFNEDIAAQKERERQQGAASDAANQRQRQTEQMERMTKELAELKNKFGAGSPQAEELEESLDALRQRVASGGAATLGGLESAFRPNPKDAERLLNRMLLAGKWESPQAAALAETQMTKLKELGDGSAELLAAMFNLVNEVGQEVEFTKAAAVLLTRENLVELHKQEGVMFSLRMMMKLAGLNVQVAASGDVWRGRIAMDQLLPQHIVNDPQYRDLFVMKKKILDVEREVSRSFWDLKDVHMDKFGKMMKTILASELGKPADDPDLEKAYAISVGLLRQSRVLEQFATDLDHPWVNTAFYRLMHPGDMLIKRALAKHPAAEKARHAAYIRSHKQDFVVRRSDNGRYDDRDRDGRVKPQYQVPGTNYSWNELLFPADSLKSWIFADNVMEGKKTFWDHLRTQGTGPVAEDWKEQDMWLIEGFKRNAAVSLDKLLFAPRKDVKTGTSQAFAADAAVETLSIAKALGIISKTTTQEKLTTDVLEKIHHLMRVVVMSGVGMGPERGKVSFMADKAYVVALGLSGQLVLDTGGVLDDGTSNSRVVDVAEPAFIKWLGENGRPLSNSGFDVIRQKIWYWLSQDPEAQQVVKILAQGIDGAEADRVVNYVMNRMRVLAPSGTVIVPGIGTHPKHQAQLSKFSKDDKSGYKATTEARTQFDFEYGGKK